MRVIKKFEMRKLKHGCGVVAQNLLLNYSLFKITLNPSKKVEFSSEKQKDMSDDGTILERKDLISPLQGLMEPTDSKVIDSYFSSMQTLYGLALIYVNCCCFV